MPTFKTHTLITATLKSMRSAGLAICATVREVARWPGGKWRVRYNCTWT